MRRLLAKALGFTLIELLVVILIIGILIAVAAPSFLGQTKKAYDSAAQQQLALAYREAKLATVDNDGSYPITSDDPTLRMNDLVGQMQEDEPSLQFSAGPNYLAATGLPSSSIVLDSVLSTSDNLVMYDQSGSGTILCLVAPADGVQSIHQVGDPECPTVDPTTAGYPLSVEVLGPGRVSSSANGVDGNPVNCPADPAVPTDPASCFESYDASTPTVTLTAAPDSGASFIGWAGDFGSSGDAATDPNCYGTSGTCQVTMDELHGVTAIFQSGASSPGGTGTPGGGSGSTDPTSPGPSDECAIFAVPCPSAGIAVRTTGSSKGQVYSLANSASGDPAGTITCISDCAFDFFAVGEQITLHAQPVKGASFVKWSDGTNDAVSCNNSTSTDCVVTLSTADISFITANFSGGSSSSSPPPPPPGNLPINTDAPTISNTSGHSPAQPIDLLTGTQGTWDNSPTSYDYQWQRSANGGSTWTDISQDVVNYATQPQNLFEYWIQHTDVGDLVRLKVTAHNTDGQASAFSDPVAGGNVVDPISSCGSASGSHDNVANALPLREGGDSASASNSGATLQSNESGAGAPPPAGTIWFCWTAPDGGMYQIDTFGTQFGSGGSANDDTVIQAFQVFPNSATPTFSPSNVSPVMGTQNDDYSGYAYDATAEVVVPNGYPTATYHQASNGEFQAVKGNTYWIQVARRADTATYTGTVQLNVTKLESVPVNQFGYIPWIDPGGTSYLAANPTAQTCQPISVVAGNWRYEGSYDYQWQVSTDGGTTWTNYTPAPAALDGNRGDLYGFPEQTYTTGFPVSYNGDLVRAIVTASNANGSAAPFTITDAATLTNGC